MTRPDRIVVGVDGSSAADEALAWAMHEAQLRGADLEVIHAWEFPVWALTRFGDAALPVFTPEDLEKAAEELVHDAVLRVRGDTSSVAMTTDVVRGHPADVLVERSKGASLLVVGSQGHGGFTGMLLGSVSDQVAHHATCPVAVVRGDRN